MLNYNVIEMHKTNALYLVQYGHPDTLAVGSVVGVVRFCPRSHFRTARVLESATC